MSLGGGWVSLACVCSWFRLAQGLYRAGLMLACGRFRVQGGFRFGLGYRGGLVPI